MDKYEQVAINILDLLKIHTKNPTDGLFVLTSIVSSLINLCTDDDISALLVAKAFHTVVSNNIKENFSSEKDEITIEKDESGRIIFKNIQDIKNQNRITRKP